MADLDGGYTRALIGSQQPRGDKTVGAGMSVLEARIKELGAAAGLTCKGPHVGHSTGILLHENPRLQPTETAELEAGMVIAVEPTGSDPGFGVYHIEDLVVVTNGEPRNLSDYTDTTTPFIIR